MRIDELSIRFAKEFLITQPETYASILAAIVNAQEAQIKGPSIGLPIHLKRAFKNEGWGDEAPTVEDWPHTRRFELFKSRVAIEIEFSRYEFIYRDFIRFLAAYNANKIDVGVIITNTREGLERIKYKSSGPNYERVLEELDWLRPTLTVPLWVIGLR